jgi:hypothetical protein
VRDGAGGWVKIPYALHANTPTGPSGGFLDEQQERSFDKPALARGSGRFS